MTEESNGTDPYGNVSPGVSSIAVESSAEGEDSGRSGHPYLLAISVFLLLVFMVPFIIQIINFSR